MRILTSIFLLVFLGGCRGEPVPRDRQNTPSSATSPVDVNPGSVDAQPSYGAQGTSAPYETTTLADPPGQSDTVGATDTQVPADAITTTDRMSMPAPSPTP